MALVQASQVVSGAQTVGRRRLDLRVGGANRGALKGLSAIADFAMNTRAAAPLVRYIDPSPGRSEALVDEARKLGIEAVATEARFEDVLRDEPSGPDSVNIVHIDSASSIERVLAEIRNPTLLYWIWCTPQARLLGVRNVLGPHDASALAKTSTLVRRAVHVTERGRADAIFGAGAVPSHVLREPLVRNWFGEHMSANLAKVIAGVEPVSAAVEVTDGFVTMPMVILIREGWSNPIELAEQAMAESTTTLRRGSQFVVAEVTPEGIRLHMVRIRLDGRWSTRGLETIDRAAADEQWEDYQRRLRIAVQQAERETLSKHNPLRTTD